ncbi:MAG: hypothetical protein IAG13_01390 [Deltaproteobacteria bacterium]|nr:hypothetical protein [Nannocystaceae bacterium]
MPDRQVASIEAADDEILVAGGDYGSGEGYVVPIGFGLDADGDETWSFTPDPTEFELTSGWLTDVARTPDGALVFSGEMVDFDIKAYPTASYAYVVRTEL